MKYFAEIITIGAELLKGSVLNTNAQFLGRELTGLGFSVKHQTSCDDQIEAIESAVRESLCRSHVVILTGGLGPTPDDVTRDALASFFHVPLLFSKSQFREIQKHYKRAGKSVPKIVRREAMFPANAEPLINRHGIALGFLIRSEQRLLVVLPGVPFELQRMFHELVKPVLRKHSPELKKLYPLTIKTVGLSEPDVMERLGKDFFEDPFEFGIYPAPGEVAVRVQASSRKIYLKLAKKVKLRLRESIYSDREEKFTEKIAGLLLEKRKTIAVAESCTGGLLAEMLTRIPRASRFFQGGVVAYSNAVKTKCLNVPNEILKKRGAVSLEVAKKMAEQVREKMKADYGLAITGIAGPSGGSKQKPVGTVFLSLASSKKTKVWEKIFWGDREQIRVKASIKILEFLWREIQPIPQK